MGSIIASLGSRDIPRIRIGIGRPLEDADEIKHVLGGFHHRGTASDCGGAVDGAGRGDGHIEGRPGAGHEPIQLEEVAAAGVSSAGCGAASPTAVSALLMAGIPTSIAHTRASETMPIAAVAAGAPHASAPTPSITIPTGSHAGCDHSYAQHPSPYVVGEIIWTSVKLLVMNIWNRYPTSRTRTREE